MTPQDVLEGRAQWAITEADCIDWLRSLPDACLDSIVTDPPYGIGFMGREWDTFKPEAVAARVERKARKNTPIPEGHGAGESAGYVEYDFSLTGARRFQAWCEAWAREALRVLKPGGHLVAFGGCRMYHRLACGVEDAGFEMRDRLNSLSWVFASGFPKSLNVSKAIDHARRRDYVLAAVRLGLSIPGNNLHDWTKAEHAPGDEWWEKFKAVLSPEQWGAIEREVIAERRGLTTTFDVGSSAQRKKRLPITAAATDEAAAWDGWGTALKPAYEPILLARKPLAGTVAATVLRYGTGALNIDACRVGFANAEDERESKTKNRHADFDSEAGGNQVYGDYSMVDRKNYDAAGRWPPNLLIVHHPDCIDSACVPECHAAELDRQSGESVSRKGQPRGAASGAGWGMTATGAEYDDAGGASRFFPQFRYEPKADRAERDFGLGALAAKTFNRVNAGGLENDPRWAPTKVKNFHPTVKPIGEIVWLLGLVTPPGGIAGDLFTGSGTTGIAALRGGWRFIGCEREPEYVELARARIAGDSPMFNLQPEDAA